ncbi:FAD-binding oxidoreductase [Solitalea lacus]|uniref:FAD-binding oxidoreductase n=1 Tax=Solitalea lacus TaxID=2911172 RepID=UPI001EDC6160|nr:FAD-binding oxidoreductase [Solitalea lacus]UKJ06967.1 FAD-binding oxidoreductase [Solitalea lacus]
MEQQHTVKIISAEYITHDVKRFRVEKPAGFVFEPGQATEVSINLPGMEDEKRPFTFTSLNQWDYLEFIIKIYEDHKGVTNELGKINAGTELIIGDPWGTIEYKGTGVFIAGGAGITPFIAILRSLKVKGMLPGNSLIFSNKTSHDVILDNELTEMLGSDFYKVFTRENVVGFKEQYIDEIYLKETVKNFSQHFYVCGPEKFITDICKILEDLGANAESLVFER